MTLLTYGHAWKLARQRATRLAVWSRRFGTFSVPLAVIGVIFHRTGAADGMAGLAVLALFVGCALLGMISGILALIRIWNDGYDGTRFAFIGMIWSLVVLILPAATVPALFTLPRLWQATTDFADPPTFVETARQIAAGEHQPNQMPPGQEAAQKAAYPTVVPLRVDLPVVEAYELALQLVESNGWQIVARHPPREILRPRPTPPALARSSRRAPNPSTNRQPPKEERAAEESLALKEYSAATIEAIARTRFYGFKDDVIIRLTPLQAETRIDMRSASRFGEFDFGVNARRIVDYLGELRDRAAER